MLPQFAVMALAIAVAWFLVARLQVASPSSFGAAANRIAFPGGVHIHDPSAAIARLKEPDEIVIPHDHAVLVIDYPLSVPAKIELQSPVEHGFTRAELIKSICEEYANVYETEEATAHIKPLALEERTSATRHRNRTDGLYGIYGHDLHDLVMTSMRWSRDSRGVIHIELHVTA